MKHDDALLIAKGLVERLRPVCERIEIAGSIRRGKDEVKDIEIIAVPDPSPVPLPRPVFGQKKIVIHKTRLDALLFEICKEGWIRPDIGKEKNKKFVIAIKDFPHITLDLFLVTSPAQWGVIFLMRTGPADFSHWVVTRKKNGGVMPNGFRQQDGAVWEGEREVKDLANETLIGFDSEKDYLNFLGLGWIEPGERQARWTK